MANKEVTAQGPRELEAWDPFREFRGLTGMAELLDGLFGALPEPRLAAAPRAWAPRVNIRETDKEYVITAALPGLKKEEVKVSVQDGVLMIAGDHQDEKEEKGKGWLRREMSCGSFRRSFVLPVGTHPEEVHASQKDGVLTVTLPRPRQEKSRGVTVKVD